MENKQISKISLMVVALVTIFLLTELGLALPKTVSESLQSSPEVLMREAERLLQEEGDLGRAVQCYETFWQSGQ